MFGLGPDESLIILLLAVASWFYLFKVDRGQWSILSLLVLTFIIAAWLGLGGCNRGFF